MFHAQRPVVFVANHQNAFEGEKGKQAPPSGLNHALAGSQDIDKLFGLLTGGHGPKTASNTPGHDDGVTHDLVLFFKGSS
jgi:hypothetical protein